MPTLQFKGKALVESHHLSVPYHQLCHSPARSCGEQRGLAGNLIIQGDNLLALKALLPSLAGQVGCVYIDPPYNTGNEGWAYSDSVSGPLHQEWLRRTVDRDDLTRHDKWLCMMLPRLRLLRELLREDGLLFVSIDDNEVHHLRMLLDEIFGERNFLATIVWQKVYSPRMDSRGFSTTHDYILAYGNGARAAPRRLLVEQDRAQFAFVDQRDGRPYRRRSLRKEGKDSLRADAPSLFFALAAPDGSPVFPIKPDGSEGRWRWSLRRYQRELAAGGVEWVRQPDGWQAYARQYLDPAASRPPGTLWLHDEVGHSHEAQQDLAALLGRNAFETPKPVRLVKQLLRIGAAPDALVLDSFAGSGTTAQAALALNAEDGGARRFVLVEQEHYADSITAERVRRAIAGVPGAPDPQLRAGYGGGFGFFTLGEPIDLAGLLSGARLPAFRELARYVFFTATGEPLDERQLDEARGYLGASRRYEVYLIYRPDVQFLKRTPLTLEWAGRLGPPDGRARLVIASHKHLDEQQLRELRIEFCQLPFGLYQFEA